MPDTKSLADKKCVVYRCLQKSILYLALMSVMVQAQALEVIINIDDVQQLSRVRSLSSIFSMRTRLWPNGEKIHVFVLADDNELHKAFVKEKLHIFPHQLRRTWNRMTYTGIGQSPVTVDSVAEMLEKVKRTKNSIGYIDKKVEDENIHYFNAQ